MQITTTQGPRVGVPDFGQLCDDLFDVLQAVAGLEPLAPHSYPLLDALLALDQEEGDDRARRLMVLGAVLHEHADERRIAEYLLRHRHELSEGRPPRSLIAAARFAAEMDVRRAAARELPVDAMSLAWPESDDVCLDVPSVGELVVDFLAGATCLRIQCAAEGHIRDATATAMELAERHVLNGGVGPSLIAMRPSARPAARLVTHLRECLPSHSARCLARVLVGSDGTDITTAALWWAAAVPLDIDDVPALVRSRWTRDLQVLDAECATSRGDSTTAA